MFGTVVIGAGKMLKNRFRTSFGGRKYGKQLWVARVLLLFRMYGRRDGCNEKYAIIQYMKCGRPFDLIDERIASVCLR